MDLCAHGTIGAAHAIIQNIDIGLSSLKFYTEQQTLVVEKLKQQYLMTMPQMAVTECYDKAVVEAAIGIKVSALYKGRSYLAWIDNENVLLSLTPDLDKLMALDLPGVIIATLGDKLDYVCRYFAPKKAFMKMR